VVPRTASKGEAPQRGYSKTFGRGMRLTRRLAFHAEATAK
jgi:hypothetical protein